MARPQPPMMPSGGLEGAFDGAVNGIKIAKAAGLEFQINTVITKTNLAEIPAILALAESLRGLRPTTFSFWCPQAGENYIVDTAIDAKEYEETLNWFYDQRDKTPLQLKATCAPHYYRILRQRAKAEGKKVSFETHGLDAVTRGCLAGTGFCFISHVGRVQTCGFLDVTCGNIKTQHFKDVWEIQKCLTNCAISTILNPNVDSANTNRCAADAGPGHTRPPAITWARSLCAHTIRPAIKNNLTSSGRSNPWVLDP